ncbi:MAG: ATP-binding protein, partial [Acetobacterales bacterium]
RQETATPTDRPYFSSLLDEKIRGTAQLHYGLARAKDVDTEDRAACSAFLSAVREEYPQYTGILTIKPDGSLFCDSLRTGRELDLRDRRYFIEARDAASGVTLQPAFGRLTGLSVLQIAHPARSPAGQLKFVLLASLDLGRFVEGYQRHLQSMEILLVDRDGTVLVWRGGTKQTPTGGMSITGSELLRLATTENMERVEEVSGIGGRREIWSISRMSPSLYDAGLHIMVGLPRNDLLAAANRRLHQDIAILAGVWILLFAGVWTLAERGIRRPVGRIAAMATSLGRGDLDARIPPPLPGGELGALMSVLNGTAESLKQQRIALEELDQRLRHSQKMDAIGQLTGGVAHDFNNLLTVILGNAEVLAESLTADHRLRLLAEMTAKAAQRGAELTNRLLAFARRQPLDPRVVDVNRQIADMDPLLRRTLGEHIEIRMSLTADLWPGMVDPGQLENALLNLCINARDAMSGGGRLTIETANTHLDAEYTARQVEVEPGQYVLIAVSDTGVGMDAATLERAFEPFFTTKDVGKGSGLGLSMVYGFVKQSRGHVRIYSEPGEGTTVKLYLPRATADETTAEPAGDEAPVERGNERILVVEDNDMVRDHVAGQLTNLGYAVVAVGNGPEAMAILERGESFDLLFTDIVMPGGMSGRQLADAVQALRPGLPVLFTSGYTENAIVHHGRLDRGVHLLAKPYRHQELAEKMRLVLAQNVK